MSDASQISWLNGEPVSAVPALDRGLAYGQGVFETIRVFEGKAPLLDYHLQRLAQGMQALLISGDSGVIGDQLSHFLSKQEANGIAKVIVTAGVGGRGYQQPEQAQANVILQWHPLPSAVQTPLTVRICDYQLPESPMLAGIKHLNRLDQILARAEWSDPAIHEGIVLDQQQRVIEAITSNIFVRIGDCWLTPTLTRCGVAGVMRRLVIERLCPRARNGRS